MFIASVRLSVCLKPKFGRLKTKFDDDAEGTRETKFCPTFYFSICLLRPSVRPSVCLSVCLKPKFGCFETKFDDDEAEGSYTEHGPDSNGIFLFNFLRNLQVCACVNVDVTFRKTSSSLVLAINSSGGESDCYPAEAASRPLHPVVKLRVSLLLACYRERINFVFFELF